jgi:chromosomal replication initiator protein
MTGFVDSFATATAAATTEESSILNRAHLNTDQMSSIQNRSSARPQEARPFLRTVSITRGRFAKENLTEFPELQACFDRYLSVASWENQASGLVVFCPTSFHQNGILKVQPQLEKYLQKPIMKIEVRRDTDSSPVSVSANSNLLARNSQPIRSSEPFSPAKTFAPQNPVIGDFSHRTSSPTYNPLSMPSLLRREDPAEVERRKRQAAPFLISSRAFDGVIQLAKRWSMGINQGLKGQALWVHGPSGSGKTHLLKQLHTWVDVKHRLHTTDVMKFFHEWRRALEAKDNLSFVRKYRKEIDVFVLENIDELANKNRTQEEVLYTVNAILDRGGSIVVSSTRHPLELKEIIEPSLYSRLFSGLLLEMPKPDSEFKENLWRKYVNDYGLSEFPLDMALFERLINIRVDTARKVNTIFVNAIGRFSLNRSLRASDILELESLHSPGAVVLGSRSPQEIIDTVAQLCGVQRAAVLGKVRRANIALARRFICLALARFLGLTNATISVLVEKDPSTVSHALKSLEEDIQNVRVIAEQWNWICTQLGMPMHQVQIQVASRVAAEQPLQTSLLS